MPVLVVGASGTNAHVILEQAPAEDELPLQVESDAVLPFVVSAKGARALAGQAQRAGRVHRGRRDRPTARVAAALASGRAVLSDRAVAVRFRVTSRCPVWVRWRVVSRRRV
ncbi:hypothetical protein STANM309S_00615 [Streptomyces tanashiensis]